MKKKQIKPKKPEPEEKPVKEFIENNSFRKKIKYDVRPNSPSLKHDGIHQCFSCGKNGSVAFNRD